MNILEKLLLLWKNFFDDRDLNTDDEATAYWKEAEKEYLGEQKPLIDEYNEMKKRRSSSSRKIK